jgi:hypothetical protein
MTCIDYKMWAKAWKQAAKEWRSSAKYRMLAFDGALDRCEEWYKLYKEYENKLGEWQKLFFDLYNEKERLLSKVIVLETELAARNNRTCSNCKHWLPENDFSGACAKIRLYWTRDFSCKYWEAVQ